MTPENQTPLDSEHQSKGAGPVVGTIIIVLLLIFGALYFWGARLNAKQQQLPLIPASTSSQ